MWEFAVGLMLLRVGGGESIQLPAVHLFAMLLTTAFIGPSMRKLIASISVLRGPLLTLFFQNFSIFLASLCGFYVVDIPDSPRFYVAVSFIIGLSCFARLASVGRSLSIENRWAAALCHGDRSALAILNAQLRRIDLGCKIIAPVLCGFMISFFSYKAAAITIAFVNILAWPIEMRSFRRVYSDPWCRECLDLSPVNSLMHAETGVPTELTDRIFADPKCPEGLAAQGKSCQFYTSQVKVWKSSFALAMLHTTVLSFGQIMTVYVMTLGISAALVAVYRSASELLAVLGKTCIPRRVVGKAPVNAATSYIWIHFTCLVPTVLAASAWARSWPVLLSSTVLVGGVSISRLGLLGFDMYIQQHIRENVSPRCALGMFRGTQGSLESFCGAVAPLLGMVLHEPQQFQYLALMSLASVGCAALLHTCSSFSQTTPSTLDGIEVGITS